MTLNTRREPNNKTPETAGDIQMDKQYKERGIYKVRQDGTKDFVAFKTREEKLAEESTAGEKNRALVLQTVDTFISDMRNLDVDCRDWSVSRMGLSVSVHTPGRF